MTGRRADEQVDAAWEGVMLDYIEDDVFGRAYQRTIPGWKCRACGQVYGTSGLPPDPCKCGRRWRAPEPGLVGGAE